ncbi:hypothetical protein COV81_00125 [Candidatus Peregrinibacteria bacterium CG11_big_fil_rev_8_21_14_0_20_41_10]|nr:MAG: hypothetical protein COV81_00125 [Candidatus Peregrinibacteria bacterium CG11_big_fil_rev_8_21_14_0_20_41_10]PIZ73347.1 MAG: hypothetical protein COY06_05530 [Candidatus Peregrinibacteria bacterium CG_4_10_14_0_2_um_filter_41_8]PJC38051.1 MAG: hypothetical protein CO045_02320 [Candidatus Peregrinibacteria bacterium CG_4_9_14_0_2_um_filter_41_14]
MKKIQKQVLKYYWQKVRTYPRYLFAIFLGQSGGIAADLVKPYIYKLIIDLVVLGSTNYNRIFGLLVIILVSEIILSNLWRVAGFAGIKLQTEAMTSIANESFDYLQQHSYTYFSNNFTGALVKRLNRFISSFESIADRITWNLLTLTIRTILVLVILTIADWRIAAVLLVWLTIYGLTLRWYLNWHTKMDTTVASQETKVTAQLADSITNFENVKLFSNVKYERKRFRDTTGKLKDLMKISWTANEWYFAFQTILMVIGEFGIMWITLKFWQQNLLTIGTVLLVQAYVVQIMSRVWDLSHVFKDIYRNLSNAEEMMVILNSPHEVKDKKGAKTLKVTKGTIQLKDISYAYENIQTVFKNLNITIKSQEKIAIVGESGAGKSTLVKLLLRFYDLQKGQILIDGQGINQITQASLRQNIAFVPQDPAMFHRSIIENIRYGRLNATDEEVIKAAKLARCHEFIMKSPQGYQTKVGERGIKLSGGERQRIAIARAILKNAPILVLDEATSSLDSRSERLIQAALHNLMKNKTVIAIAHRLSTVKEMDRIIVLENGVILEEGKHAELLTKDKHYAELWKIQSGGNS